MVKIQSSVHTRLENGMLLRREVLETALKTTQILQLLKVYKKENTDKKKMLTKFKSEISDLRQTVHDLEFKDLPQDITRRLMPQKPQPVIKQNFKSLKQVEREVKKEIETPVIKSEIEIQVADLKRQIDNIKI